MAGRVQFPTEPPDPNRPGDPAVFFVSPRSHAARSKASLLLPLFGEDVDVDVGPVVREALVCYVNKELLIPEKAAVPGPDQLNELLAQMGTTLRGVFRALFVAARSPASYGRATPLHGAIVAAIAAHDPAGSEQAVRDLIADTAADIERAR